MGRISVGQAPPTKADIERVLQHGATKSDVANASLLLRHLRQSGFIDDQYRPLGARARLADQYLSDGVALFLGAGVSCESGIPSWRDLTGRMLANSGIALTAPDRERLTKEFPSFIAQFDLIAHRLGYREFLELLYECLYASFDAELNRLLGSIPQSFEEQEQWDGWGPLLDSFRCNKTLAAVGELLVADDRKPNANIRGVVTFNADHLVELYCQARASGSRPLTTVDRPSVGDHLDRISVYHLHGTLDARGENFLKRELSDDLLPEVVFTESQYYETFTSPMSYVNHTPQSILRQFNCLFIGISIEDINLRRWLYASFRERAQHREKFLREYYRKDYADVRIEAELESMRHFWLRTESRDLPKDEIDLSMRNLGVQVVWCKDREEVRDVLTYLASFRKESA